MVLWCCIKKMSVNSSFLKGMVCSSIFFIQILASSLPVWGVSGNIDIISPSPGPKGSGAVEVSGNFAVSGTYFMTEGDTTHPSPIFDFEECKAPIASVYCASGYAATSPTSQYDGKGTLYSSVATWTWIPAAAGTYAIAVEVRNAGTTVDRDTISANAIYTVGLD